MSCLVTSPTAPRAVSRFVVGGVVTDAAAISRVEVEISRGAQTWTIDATLSSPFAPGTQWNLIFEPVNIGSYTFVARAYDIPGNVATSSAGSFFLKAPSVSPSVVTPTGGATGSGGFGNTEGPLIPPFGLGDGAGIDEWGNDEESDEESDWRWIW